MKNLLKTSRPLEKTRGKRARGEGFTLIELLIVVAIIGILAVIIIVAINPSQLMAKSRDSQRFSDVTSLATAINLYLADNKTFSGLVDNTEYISTDSNLTDATRRLNNGNGWLPIDFTDVSSGAPMSALPIDPINGTEDGIDYHYSVEVDTSDKTYEINCLFEHSDNTSKHGTDGGTDGNVYEVGTDLTLL